MEFKKPRLEPKLSNELRCDQKLEILVAKILDALIKGTFYSIAIPNFTKSSDLQELVESDEILNVARGTLIDTRPTYRYII